MKGWPWLRIGLIAIALVGAGFALWWVLVRPVTATREAAQSRVEAKLGTATGTIATDAIPIINDASRAKEAVGTQVQKGIADVRAAPDAGVKVDGVSAALRRNLCLSGAYAADRACQPVHEDPVVERPARPD